MLPENNYEQEVDIELKAEHRPNTTKITVNYYDNFYKSEHCET